MLSRKTVMAIGAGAALCTLVGVAIGTAVNLNDPEEPVGVVSISDSEAPAVAQRAEPGGGTSRQVAALDEVSGTVRYEPDEGPDVDELVVAGVELEFGPDGWIRRAGPMEDYDGDGSAEALRDELAGLVGTEARFLVRLDGDGDEGTVYTINDLTYRDPTRQAPWLEGASDGEVATEEEILRAAAQAVGENAVVTELEADDHGPDVWEAEVTDAEGREYDVDLDAAGTVLSVERD